MVKSKLSSQLAVPFLGSRLDRNYYSRCWQVSEYSGYARGDVNWFKMTLLKHVPFCEFHLRPYRDEPSASRPIRADKHRRGQRVLTWVTSREHCAAAGFFFCKRFIRSPLFTPCSEKSIQVWGVLPSIILLSIHHPQRGKRRSAALVESMRYFLQLNSHSDGL
jgi:hypothetical protein